MDIKVKDLIKILCDFNPNADVKVIYNNEALKLFGDVSWNWGDDDSPVRSNKKLAEVKCVSLWALDKKQAQELEEETRRRFTEAPCKANCQTKEGECYGIQINITRE
jgi:hypothetical protein